MIIEFIRSLFNLEDECIIAPTINGTITGLEVYKLMKADNIHQLDKQYNLYSFQQVKDFLEKNQLNFNKFKRELYDCDDFALHLMSEIKKEFHGIPFGFVLSKGHAFNIFIDENKQVWFIEPQSDKIYKSSQKIKMVLI